MSLLSIAFSHFRKEPSNEPRPSPTPSGQLTHGVSAGTLVKEHSALGQTRARFSAVANQTDEETLSYVDLAQDGDSKAFRWLFEKHRDQIARLVFRMIGPKADVDDLVQDVFVQVYKSLPDFRGDSKFSTWLHRVTVNVVLMYRRSAKSRPVFSGEEINTNVEDSRSELPDETVEQRMRVRAFFELLDTIAEKKRVVFVLHDLEGMSPSDISTIVEAPVLTVRTRLFYARRELEERMRAHPQLASVIEQLGGFARVDNEQPRKDKATLSREGNGSNPSPDGGAS